MIHKLYSKNNKKIIDTEVYGNIEKGTFDICSVVNCIGYGDQLIYLYKNDKNRVKLFEGKIDCLNNLRGLYFEVLRGTDIVNTKEDVDKMVHKLFKDTAVLFGLEYHVD